MYPVTLMDLTEMDERETLGDEYDGEWPDRLAAAEVRRLSDLRPAISTMHLALEWFQIVAAAWVVWTFWHPLLYLLAVAFIGARQHVLIIVFMHDGAHYRLFRNRRLNDWVAELAIAWPFVLLSMRSYRRNHFPHHRHTNTEKDPDWVRKASWIYPRSPGAVVRLLLMYLLGFGFVRFLYAVSKLPRRGLATAEDRAFALGRVVYTVALLGGIVALDLIEVFLLFWIIPFATWMQLVFNLRSMADHSEIHGRRGAYAGTRTITLNWIQRLFVLGKDRAFYHVEHHMYPSVPFYRLHALHERLMELPAFRANVHVTKGFVGFVKECMRSATASKE
jgi:fatty acid desaturase